jgi:hypothetical protein
MAQWRVHQVMTAEVLTAPDDASAPAAAVGGVEGHAGPGAPSCMRVCHARTGRGDFGGDYGWEQLQRP